MWDNLLGHSIIINYNPLGREEIINETIDWVMILKQAFYRGYQIILKLLKLLKIQYRIIGRIYISLLCVISM